MYTIQGIGKQQISIPMALVFLYAFGSLIYQPELSIQCAIDSPAILVASCTYHDGLWGDMKDSNSKSFLEKALLDYVDYASGLLMPIPWSQTHMHRLLSVLIWYLYMVNCSWRDIVHEIKLMSFSIPQIPYSPTDCNAISDSGNAVPVVLCNELPEGTKPLPETVLTYH